MKKLITACLFLVSGSINAGVVSVIDGDHNVINGWGGDLGLSGLGHTSTFYSNNTSSWNSALSSGADAIVVEQNAYAGDTGSIQSYLNSGGRMVVLGDHRSVDTFLNSILGTSMDIGLTNGTYGTTVASKTGLASGTTFANDAEDLTFLSSTHSVGSGASSLPTNAEIFYDGPHGPHVFRTSYGDGDLFYIGWDFCCQGSIQNRNDYYAVLDSAINFESVTVSEPLTIALLGLGVTGIAATRRRKIA